MADVTLNSAVRDSLLSLQSTTKLIEQTQGRLSSGLKVSSPIDDPVAYFQAKTLTDRSFDFNEKKDSIDQGVSTVTAALDGVNSIESLVRQMKGVANSMKSATSTQLSDLVSQFNDLRTQINNLAADATYQGTNLINGSGTTLDIEFSNLSSSILSVGSVDLTVASDGLDIAENAEYSAGVLVADYAAKAVNSDWASTGYIGTNDNTEFGYLNTDGDNYLSAGDSVTFTWAGPENAVSAGDTLTLNYGTATMDVNVKSGVTLNNGDTFSVSILSAGDTDADYYVNTDESISHTTNFAVSHDASTGFDNGDTVTLTWNGSDDLNFSTANNTFSASLMGATGNFSLGSSTVLNVSAGGTFTVTLVSAADAMTGGVGLYFNAGADVGGTSLADTAIAADSVAAADTDYNFLSLATSGGITANTVSETYVAVGTTADVNSIISGLDTALETLRTQASTLGSNVATLQTRLDFTETYVNTLDEGSGKLTLADVNEEGANLLALQTRQQLGINSLSFAGQAEQSILSLFG